MNDKAQNYLKTRVLSATPEELRLMLLEGALRYARQGREGLSIRNYEQSYDGIHRCQNILIELINSLRPEHNPDLCDKLSGLYLFLYRRLMDASLERNASHCDEVIQLLEYEVETWTMLMAKLTAERGGGSSAVRLEDVPDNSHPRETKVATESTSAGRPRNAKLAALASPLSQNTNRPSISIQG